jgi:nucleotide-binding universal stress UspA family protein
VTAPIVIPLDGSERALVALPVAKELAEQAGATIHLVHVAREIAPPSEILARIGLTGADLRGSVLDTKAGEPGAAIIQAASELDAELIVMCTHTAATPADKTVGRTALRVLKGAPCPVVFVRPGRGITPWVLGHVLLAHDGTPVTSAAIRPAAEIARRSAAVLDVLHVASPREGQPTERGALTVPRYMDQPQHEWPEWVQEFMERLACICPFESLKLRMFLAPGVPGDEVLRFANTHRSDLIVLAWRGEWEGGHAATVKAVLGHAASAVMVIRTRCNGSSAAASG